MWQLVSFVLLVATPIGILGHGRLSSPPGRSTCWRHGFADCEINYDDAELYCGGFSRHWNQNGGKCGVCGDAWDLAQPRPNEAGGKYGNGVIVETYESGATIDVTVDLVQDHYGWFEFRLCENNNVNQIITHDCLNENLLEFADGTTRYEGPIDYRGNYYLSIKLPPGLTCSQCVLQWKYHAGNSWGCDDNGDCGMGLGPQEEFYGCADVEIV